MARRSLENDFSEAVDNQLRSDRARARDTWSKGYMNQCTADDNSSPRVTIFEGEILT